MATNAWNSLTNKQKHTVGNITSTHKYVQDVPNGALFTENVDNFILAELGFNAEGERTAKNLTSEKTEGFLVAAPERRYLGESLSEFFVGENERGRVLHLTKGLRFDTSAFSVEPSKSAVAGAVAHFDVTTKKFHIHDGTHAKYDGAKNKFVLVSSEDDIEYTLGAPTIRFEAL